MRLSSSSIPIAIALVLLPAALSAQAKVDLQSELIASGTAQGILDDWVAVLKAQASDLVPAATVDSEAAALEEYLG